MNGARVGGGLLDAHPKKDAPSTLEDGTPCDICNMTGEDEWTANPDMKWDWWTIDGRWMRELRGAGDAGGGTGTNPDAAQAALAGGGRSARRRGRKAQGPPACCARHRRRRVAPAGEGTVLFRRLQQRVLRARNTPERMEDDGGRHRGSTPGSGHRLRAMPRLMTGWDESRVQQALETIRKEHVCDYVAQARRRPWTWRISPTAIP